MRQNHQRDRRRPVGGVNTTIGRRNKHSRIRGVLDRSKSAAMQLERTYRRPMQKIADNDARNERKTSAIEQINQLLAKELSDHTRVHIVPSSNQ